MTTYDDWKLATPPEYAEQDKPMRKIVCQCSVWFMGSPCGRSGYEDDLVVVEVVPPARRTARGAIKSSYVYPLDGTAILHVSRACAVRMLAPDPDGFEIAFGLGELTVEEVDSILAVRGIAPADFWSHFVGRHNIDTDALHLACVRCMEEVAAKDAVGATTTKEKQ